MKTATLRDLRNDFAKLEAWLQEGEDVEIFRRRKRVAVLMSPLNSPRSNESSLPDFAKRRSLMKTDLALSKVELDEIRAFEVEGEEG